MRLSPRALLSLLASVTVLLYSNSPTSLASVAPTVRIVSPASGAIITKELIIEVEAQSDARYVTNANSAGNNFIQQIGISMKGEEIEADPFTYDVREIKETKYGRNLNGTYWDYGSEVADGTWFIEPQDNGKITLKLDMTRWPNQSYEITVFAKDFSGASTKSRTIKITKVKGDIPIVKPSLDCKLMGEFAPFSLYCVSEQDIPKIPIQVQSWQSNKWVKLISQNMGGDEFSDSERISIYLPRLADGSYKLRVLSEGKMKQDSPYYLNVEVAPFVSNTVEFKLVTQSNASSSTKKPTGKVDKKSNAYKFMFTAGKNFAKVSLASDTARSQCLSALNTGLIKVRGIPQYLGAQASQIRSYLKTPSGFQGCLDGFGK